MDKIDDRRHEGQGCANTTMAAGLGPLRDDHVGTDVEGTMSLSQVNDLHDQGGIRFRDSRCECARLTE